MNTNPTTTTRASAFLFREAWRCLLDALFVLWHIERPARWQAFKDRHIVGFHSSVAEADRPGLGNTLALILVLNALLLCFIVAYVVYAVKQSFGL